MMLIATDAFIVLNEWLNDIYALKARLFHRQLSGIGDSSDRSLYMYNTTVLHSLNNDFHVTYIFLQYHENNHLEVERHDEEI